MEQNDIAPLMATENSEITTYSNAKWTFSYTGSVQEWTAPHTDKYHMYIESAAGGIINGYIDIEKGTTYYISVGGSGSQPLGYFNHSGTVIRLGTGTGGLCRLPLINYILSIS